MTAIKLALDLLDKARTIYERYIKRLPPGPEKADGEKSLREAEEAVQTARAQLAAGLGYVLCRRHFPPGVMVKVGPSHHNQWQCNTCGAKDPSDEAIQEADR